MARNMIEQLIDDLSGEEDETIETVEFTYRGEPYEIDLGKKNRDTYDEYIQTLRDKARLVFRGPAYDKGKDAAKATPVGKAARRAPGGGQAQAQSSAPAKAPSRADRQEAKALREWARANGWPELNDRGRIPDEARKAYAQSVG